MSKICKNCWWITENQLLKYCKKCTYENSFYNLKQTRINLVSDKKKERLQNWWSEKELFKEILINKQNNWYLICQYCNNKFSIENAWPFTFCHILAKGQYPAYRLFENNIMLACNIEHHHKLDEIVKDIQRDIWYKEFENLIASWEDVQYLINNYK